MTTTVKSAIAVWLLLMLSTIASTWGFSQPMFTPLVSTVAVMLIAAVKVGLVMGWFMELRHAPRAWQLTGVIWLVVTAGVVVFLYLN